MLTKQTVAALVAGVILGTTGTGVAAQSYWSERGTGYRCEGIDSGMACHSSGFQIGITPDFLYIKKGKGSTGPTFGCRKWSSWSSCFKG